MFSKLLLLIAFTSMVFASNSCTARWECSQFSNDYNYVDCIDGACECIGSFSGSATSGDKCRCDSPRSVSWNAGQPHCINHDECTESNLSEERKQRRFDIVKSLYTDLVFPIPQGYIYGGVPIPDNYADEFSGRVTPAGKFSDLQGSLEYFYGLAASAHIREVTFPYPFTYDEDSDSVGMRVDLDFLGMGPGESRNLSEVGQFQFNDEDKISSFDLQIVALGDALDNNDPAAQTGTRQQVCYVHTTYCHGADQQYTDFADCMTQLAAKDHGTWHSASSDTVTCRSLHSSLVPIRPDIHCPHIGPNGGGKCVPFDYDTYFDYYFIEDKAGDWNLSSNDLNRK